MGLNKRFDRCAKGRKSGRKVVDHNWTVNWMRDWLGGEGVTWARCKQLNKCFVLSR